MTKMSTTKHTHLVVFGRKVADCPRCAELLAGAEPVRWAGTSGRQEAIRRSADIAGHFASAKHTSGGCGLVCTYGDW
jgi:hypothetical protein